MMTGPGALWWANVKSFGAVRVRWAEDAIEG